MKLLTQILRILTGLLFLAAAAVHFYYYKVMAVYVPLPVGSKYFVLFVATLITFLSVAILLNFETRKAFFALAIIFAVTGMMILIPTIFFSNDMYLKLIQLPNLYKVLVAIIILIALAGTKPK